MKQYPSIPSASALHGKKCHTFLKYDGSCIRCEFSPVQGWYKFGSRHQLIDKNHPTLGAAIPLFFNHFADELEKIIKKNKWKKLTAYFEFWGKHSFAGFHLPNDPKNLTLIDLNVLNEGIISPEKFLDVAGHLNIAHYFGKYVWNLNFIKRVREDSSEFEGLLTEGVVGKVWDEKRKKLYMGKAKCQKWYDKLYRTFPKEEADKLA